MLSVIKKKKKSLECNTEAVPDSCSKIWPKRVWRCCDIISSVWNEPGRFWLRNLRLLFNFNSLFIHLFFAGHTSCSYVSSHRKVEQATLI